jgi:hypothetical protein
MEADDAEIEEEEAARGRAARVTEQRLGFYTPRSTPPGVVREVYPRKAKEDVTSDRPRPYLYTKSTQ